MGITFCAGVSSGMSSLRHEPGSIITLSADKESDSLLNAIGFRRNTSDIQRIQNLSCCERIAGLVVHLRLARIDRDSSDVDTACGAKARYASRVATSSESKNGGGVFFGGAEERNATASNYRPSHAGVSESRFLKMPVRHTLCQRVRSSSLLTATRDGRRNGHQRRT